MAKRYEQTFTVKDKGSKNVKDATQKINKSLKDVESRTKSSTTAMIANWKKLAGSIAAVAGVAALTRLVKSTIDYADQLGKLKTRLGINIKEFDKLRQIADLSGVSFQTLTMATQRMARRLAEVAQGTGVAKDAVKELGLNIDRLSSMSPDQQFLAIAKELDGVQENGRKVALAFKLFDSEGVRVLQMLPGLRDGLEGINSNMSLEKAKAAEAFNDQLTTLKENAMQLAMNILPMLNIALKILTDHFKLLAIAAAALVAIPLAGWIRGVWKQLVLLSGVVTGSTTLLYIFGAKTPTGLKSTLGLLGRLKVVIIALTRYVMQFANIFGPLIALIGGWQIGKALDKWMQQFEGYRRWLVNFVDNVIQMKILLTDFFIHPFGGTEESRAKLKANLDAHARIIKQWLENIKTHTTTGELLSGMTLPKDKYITVHPNKALTPKNYKYIPYAPRGIDLKQRGAAAKGFELAAANIELKKAAELLEKVKERTERWKNSITNVSEIISTNLTDGILGLVDSTKSWGEQFKQTAANILNELAQIIIKTALLKQIQSTISSGSGAGAFLSWLGFAKGGITPMMPGAAVGQQFSGPKSGYPVMLHGNEAVMPLRRGADGNLGVQSVGGGGSVTIVNNINIENGDSLTDAKEGRRTLMELQRMVIESSRAAIRDEMRVGGMLNSSINRRVI